MRDDEPSVAYEPAPWSAETREYFVRRKRSVLREYVRPALLLVLTIAAVYYHGEKFHQAGWPLVVTAIGIMLAHEMGHYVACRYYKVDAALPHFLPAPEISLVGTFGAFIRIRGPIPHRKALFDIGVAGPLAGFLACLPVLYLAAQEVQLVPATHTSGDPGVINLMSPLAMRLALSWFMPHIDVPAGHAAIAGPYYIAGWFGLLLTALNLMPVGQLDGGHATYALLRGRAALISRVASWLCLGLLYFGPSYLLWWLLLRLLGRPHPPTIDDERPVGRVRAIVGVACIAVFALCFRPDPFEFSWAEIWRELRFWLFT